MTKESEVIEWTNHARMALVSAKREAVNLCSPVIEPIHLLLALAKDTGSAAALVMQTESLPQILKRLPPATLQEVVAKAYALTAPVCPRTDAGEVSEVPNSPALEQVILLAEEESIRFSSGYIATEHLLYGLASYPDEARTVLLELGIDGDEVIAAKAGFYGVFFEDDD